MFIHSCDEAFRFRDFKIEQDIFGDHYQVVIYADSDKVYVDHSQYTGCIGDYGDESGEFEERIVTLIRKRAEQIRASNDESKKSREDACANSKSARGREE
jgi:hypothetical protein